MAEHRLKLPDVGEGVVEAEIVAWHVAVGDRVEEDQDVVDVMTDKATVEIPSPVTGTVIARNGDVGDTLPVGSDLLIIERADIAEAEPDASVREAPGTQDPDPAQEAPPPSVEGAGQDTGPSDETRPVLAAPAVRMRAQDLGIDLASLRGSGPEGRITHQDLDQAVHGDAARGQRPTPASRQRNGTRDTKIVGLRRRIARNLTEAWQIPHITYVEEVDVTEVETLRQTLNARYGPRRPKLTFLPFLATALTAALREVPQANAHYEAEREQLTEFDAVHLGIATATGEGLKVPVLRHAEVLDLWALAGEIARLSAAARDGTATRDELSGSTVTITSLGGMGGVVVTPILNPPETAILGVNRIVERPAFDDRGRVVARKLMNLSSSFDHRIVDGYDAAQLIQSIRQRLEAPATLFLD